MDYSLLEAFCLREEMELISGEDMSRHTSFRTGGKADRFLRPASVTELAKVIKEAKRLQIPYFILGKGSNLLVSDEGMEGLVIDTGLLDRISVSGSLVTAQAGAALSAVCIAAARAGLSGLEFAYGIPGSVGGALFMNAGAYGGEMADCAVCCETLTPDGEPELCEAEDLALGYRTSAFRQNGSIITGVTFALQESNPETVTEAMNDFMKRRRDKQPLEYPSAGSTFKRPQGNYAGALIEASGLKGATVGGAMVSTKHAGFIINYNHATSSDIRQLMEKVQQTVKQNSGIRLEPEVIAIGR